MAMGILYVGIGVLGSAGTFLLKYLIGHYNHHVALTALGLMCLLAWPVVLLAVKDKPSDVGPEPGRRRSGSGRDQAGFEDLQGAARQLLVLAAV